MGHMCTYREGMLGMRLQGDPAEAAAFLDLLASVGVEVAPGPVKARAEGFAHAYSTVRMPEWAPSDSAPPIRVQATVGRALASPDRRPARRGRPR